MMDDDNITVKVSGTAVYKAVKNYLDNSPEFKQHIADTLEKVLKPAVENRVNGMLANLEHTAHYKIKTELDLLIKKEVETKVAGYISAGIKKMFENP